MDTENIKSETIAQNEETPSNYVPVWVFCILYFFTFGAYLVYWTYINWRYIRDKENEDYNPVWKALLIIFFEYSLFNKFYLIAKEKGYNKRLPVAILTAIFILMLLSAYTHLLLISMLSFLPLIPIVSMMNFYYRKEYPNYRIKNSMTKAEIKFLIVFWIIIIFIICIEVKEALQK